MKGDSVWGCETLQMAVNDESWERMSALTFCFGTDGLYRIAFTSERESKDCETSPAVSANTTGTKVVQFGF